jgi:hypothetical protein
VKFAAYSRSIEPILLQWVVLFTLFGGNSACQPKAEMFYTPTVLEGQSFARRIVFPSPFYESKSPQDGLFGPPIFGMGRNDQQWFRISPNSPNELLVAACDIGRERFSDNSFAVDTVNGYSVRRMTLNDWNHGKEIRDLKSLGQSVRKVREVPGGLEYHGRIYATRGDLTEGRGFASTDDGALVVVAGGLRPSGNSKYMLDVYDGTSGRRLAAVDVAYKGVLPLTYALLHVHLINARWVAITLDAEFKQMLLLDFEPQKAGRAQ